MEIIESEFKVLNVEGKKDLLLKFARDFFFKEKRGVSLKDLEKYRITSVDIRKLFGNLRTLLERCDIPIKNRKAGLSDLELKKYIIEIAVEDENGCWTTDRVGTDGKSRRPKTTYKGKSIYLYRLSYMLFIGDLIPNAYIMHKCDNEACFRPEHLDQGDALKNNRDCENKNRRPRSKNLKYGKHGLKNPYDYVKLLELIKNRITITDKNEWLYNGAIEGNGYAVIRINNKRYALHRLILANKLGIKYAEIDLACHKFPEGSYYYGDIPQKHDINPDHLYNGSSTQNSTDALSYKKNMYLSAGKVQLIRDEVKKIDLTTMGAMEFDLKMAHILNAPVSSIRNARLGHHYKYLNAGGES